MRSTLVNWIGFEVRVSFLDKDGGYLSVCGILTGADDIGVCFEVLSKFGILTPHMVPWHAIRLLVLVLG